MFYVTHRLGLFMALEFRPKSQQVGSGYRCMFTFQPRGDRYVNDYFNLIYKIREKVA